MKNSSNSCTKLSSCYIFPTNKRDNGRTVSVPPFVTPADTRNGTHSHHPHPSVLISVLHLLESWNVLVLATIVLNDLAAMWEKLASLFDLSLSILSSFTRIQREDFQSFHSFFPPFILLPSTGRASTGIPNWLETFLNRGTGPVSFSSPAVDPHDPEYPPPPPPL